MKAIVQHVLTAASLFCATTAWSADYKVKRSIEISASSTEAWHVVGDFCDIDDWLPGVKACALKVMDGSLVRVLMTDAGQQVIQKRIAREAGLSYTYKTVTADLPFENFTATFAIEPGDMVRIVWTANFSSEDPEMEQVVVQDIEAGLSAIEKMFTAR